MIMAKKTTNREKELMENFVSAIKYVFNLEIDEETYKKITAEKFVSLKKALSNINNIVTLKVTNLFIEKLCGGGFIKPDQADRMKILVNNTSANANGYDVRYDEGDKKILAEVKCNIPVNGKTFGAKQEEGIIKDIDGLLNGKTTGKVENINEYYKFMVFLNASGVPDSVNKTLEKKYKKKDEKKYDYYTNEKGDILIEKEKLSKNVVYIVFIS